MDDPRGTNADMRFSTLGLLVMLLAVALGATGMGFGIWSGFLDLDAWIQADHVVVEWSNQSGFEPFTGHDWVV